MNRLLPLLLLVCSPFLLAAQSTDLKVEASACHVFIDEEYIWTLEMVKNAGGKHVPILNIITFTAGEWEFRPDQIQIQNRQGKTSNIKKFEMDTGIPEEPYVTEYLRVLGNSFIPLDLIGDFDDFGEPSKITIDLGRNRFELKPMDCLDFETLVEKINNVNLDSPNIYEDFQVLKIEPAGQKSPLKASAN